MNTTTSPKFIPGNTIAMADSYVLNSANNTVAAFFELDITEIRQELRKKRQQGQNIALSAWIVKLVSSSLADQVLDEYPKSLDYDMWVEKKFDDRLYSVPINLKNANKITIEDISREIGFAKGSISRERNTIKQHAPKNVVNYLLYLPVALRKLLWKLFLRNPELAYQKMGNGAFSYMSFTGKYMESQINSNDVSLGISSMFHKPRFINYDIKMRDIVPVTLLLSKSMMCNQDATFFMKDLTRHINNNASFLI